jgi:hypothetical protein
MGNVGYPGAVLEMGEVQTTAKTLGLEVVLLEIRRAEDIACTFETPRSSMPTRFVSILWRWMRDCRPCPGSGTTSRPEV